MAQRVVLAALVLALVYGCGQQPVPTDPTQAALQQLRSGQYDTAIATATEAIRLKPDRAEAYLYRGRAYHFRNAMDDHQRAIADFGEAIRLAPKSSDAYYSRALVYRDIGQTQLAEADDTSARQLDGLLRETFQRIPNLSTTVKSPEQQQELEDAQVKAGAQVPKSEEDQRKVYEELKGRFEPGFGELRTPSPPTTGAPGERSLTDRYRNRLGQGRTTAESTRSAAGQEPVRDQFALPAPPLDKPANDEKTAAERSAGTTRPRGNWPTTQVPTAPPPLSSPFAQRPVTLPEGQTPTAGQIPGVHSPFPQRGAGATGFVQPVNPFGAQPGAQPGVQPTVTRPFSTSPNTPRYTNPIVRPENPRDYLP